MNEKMEKITHGSTFSGIGAPEIAAEMLGWENVFHCEINEFGRKKGGVFNFNCKNTVLRFPITQSTIHPTQKPVDLFRTLIRASSNEGDLVFDPFMGSGTTAVASIMENRKFIGFELCKEFYDKAVKRVNNVLSRPTLTF